MFDPVNKLSDVFHAFTCAGAIGNLWSICLEVNIVIPFLFYVDVNNKASESLDRLLNDVSFDVFESLSDFNEIYAL